MKKKILVPIMALAIAVTAGVNYKMISNSEMSSNISLSMLLKKAFAITEDEENEQRADPENYCTRCGEFYLDCTCETYGLCVETCGCESGTLEVDDCAGPGNECGDYCNVNCEEVCETADEEAPFSGLF